MIPVTQSSPIIPYAGASAHFEELRRRGQRIVQCHGTFDLIHPGHLVHFEEARALGDVLVVTVTGERFVNKGPGRPYFNDETRARWLAALRPVDYVVVIPHPAAIEAIACVRPHVYCKGREYAVAANDVTGNIADDVAAVERIGGDVRYVGSVVFSSTRLLNQHFEPYPPDVKAFCQQVAATCSPTELRTVVDRFEQLRVLIVGDIIFDRYATLEVQGLTSKSRILSGRFVRDEMQAGGALAVYRHIREFTPNVQLVSLVGEEPWLDALLDQYIERDARLLVPSSSFTTVVKERFVEPQVAGKELGKLFSVNFVDRARPDSAAIRRILDRLEAHTAEADVVLVMDFGHGVLAPQVRAYLEESAPLLAVNCQTNSNNHGFNILNRRYRRADVFSLDETEMTLAIGRQELDYRQDLASLAADLKSRYAWLTRGVTETLGWHSSGDFCSCAPFERSIVDTLGAGDAFCAVAALAATAGLPLDLATFMGQLSGALAVKVVGNSEPVRKPRFMKAASSMLAF
jgi:cytidyltransferase-like protein